MLREQLRRLDVEFERQDSIWRIGFEWVEFSGRFLLKDALGDPESPAWFFLPGDLLDANDVVATWWWGETGMVEARIDQDGLATVVTDEGFEKPRKVRRRQLGTIELNGIMRFAEDAGYFDLRAGYDSGIDFRGGSRICIRRKSEVRAVSVHGGMPAAYVRVWHRIHRHLPVIVSHGETPWWLRGWRGEWFGWLDPFVYRKRYQMLDAMAREEIANQSSILPDGGYR